MKADKHIQVWYDSDLHRIGPAVAMWWLASSFQTKIDELPGCYDRYEYYNTLEPRYNDIKNGSFYHRYAAVSL